MTNNEVFRMVDSEITYTFNDIVAINVGVSSFIMINHAPEAATRETWCIMYSWVVSIISTRAIHGEARLTPAWPLAGSSDPAWPLSVRSLSLVSDCEFYHLCHHVSWLYMHHNVPQSWTEKYRLCHLNINRVVSLADSLGNMRFTIYSPWNSSMINIFMFRAFAMIDM